MCLMPTIEAARAHRLDVTLTHPAAAFAAMIALEGMSDEPPHARGRLVTLTVPGRAGTVMEAAQRLTRAGVAAEDIVVRAAQRFDLAV